MSSTVTEDAYRRIRDDLLSSKIPAGEKLKIDDLCRRLAVGSSAVREALSRLASEGFVVAEPQRGFRVAPLSLDELRDLTEVRCHIESLCIQEAVDRGDVDWEVAILAALHRLSRTPVWAEGDQRRYSDEYALAHGAFHEAVAAGCGSPWLLRIRQLLFAQHERYRWLTGSLASVERDLGTEHRAIAELAVARDGRASHAMIEHLRRTMQIFLDCQPTLGPSRPTAVPERAGRELA